MPRPPRVSVGGLLYHVLNRGNRRQEIFFGHGDYSAFESILAEGCRRTGMRIVAYCLMPNHWHLVLWPSADGMLARYMGWITSTHSHRWMVMRGHAGEGHLYQDRYKSFVIQNDSHFLAVCSYVERNALRAGLVDRAENWRWSSLWRIQHGAGLTGLTADWPIVKPENWIDLVNRLPSESVAERLRESVDHGKPFGDQEWTEQTIASLGLESTARPRGRPRHR